MTRFTHSQSTGEAVTRISTDLERLRVDRNDHAAPIDNPGLGETETAEELERFRREWQKEVQSKRLPVSDPARTDRKDARKSFGEGSTSTRDGKRREPIEAPKAAGASAIPMTTSNTLDNPPVYISPSTSCPQPRPASQSQSQEPVASAARAARAAHTQKRGETAVQLYARAVEHEQSGQLNDALLLYRRAFKLDDAVDRAYQRSLNAQALIEEKQPTPDMPSSTDIVSASAPRDEPYSFQRHIQIQPDYEKAQLLKPARLSPLSAILQSLPVSAAETTFQPANEEKPIPLALLPPELLERILHRMDVRSVERFGQTCWRGRYITAFSAVWRRIVENIYKPPIIEEGALQGMVAKHGNEWRSVLIEEERVRMDGCYISVCHYVRPGAGDEWVAVTHMITYHRFLRFYPDGSVISFLTTDHPSEVVPVLRPSLRGKGLHFGRWHLDKTPAEDGSRRARIVITDLLEPGSEVPKYEFEMELSLRETQRGRWNKLDILNYQSINLGNGETLSLSLKHQKPYYFSKVKSYNPPL